MNVELRHLRALAAIGDHRSITAAAQSLHVTQPALSRTLEQLERRLGVRLVDRTTRHVALTDTGQRLGSTATASSPNSTPRWPRRSSRNRCG